MTAAVTDDLSLRSQLCEVFIAKVAGKADGLPTSEPIDDGRFDGVDAYQEQAPAFDLAPTRSKGDMMACKPFDGPNPPI